LDHGWGVVQLVGHLTVNEAGVGSSPTAPANLKAIHCKYLVGIWAEVAGSAFGAGVQIVSIRSLSPSMNCEESFA
jgi:hypothetical protein